LFCAEVAVERAKSEVATTAAKSRTEASLVKLRIERRFVNSLSIAILLVNRSLIAAINTLLKSSLQSHFAERWEISAERRRS
jgi:hypothetical protein